VPTCMWASAQAFYTSHPSQITASHHAVRVAILQRLSVSSSTATCAASAVNAMQGAAWIVLTRQPRGAPTASAPAAAVAAVPTSVGGLHPGYPAAAEWWGALA
jgi:hypothetical protein